MNILRERRRRMEIAMGPLMMMTLLVVAVLAMRVKHEPPKP
jgi:hypothetical protein